MLKNYSIQEKLYVNLKLNSHSVPTIGKNIDYRKCEEETQNKNEQT